MYGVALAVLQRGPHIPTILDQGWCPYPNSCMGRGFLYVRARLPASSTQVLFTTSHLESPIDKEGTTNGPERVRQIRQLEAFCNKQFQLHRNLNIAILSGDMNWDESVNDVYLLSTALQSRTWGDAWCELPSSKNNFGGYTFNCAENPFLEGDRRCRLDRILFHCRDEQTSSCTVRDVSLVGTDPIPGNYTVEKQNVFALSSTNGYATPTKMTRRIPIVPSDHYGLVVTLESLS